MLLNMFDKCILITQKSISLFVGHNTLSYLEEEDGDYEDARKFRETIQAWWIAAAKGAVKKLPMSHKLFSNLKWLQPGLQQYCMAARCLLQQSVFLR